MISGMCLIVYPQCERNEQCAAARTVPVCDEVANQPDKIWNGLFPELAPGADCSHPDGAEHCCSDGDIEDAEDAGLSIRCRCKRSNICARPLFAARYTESWISINDPDVTFNEPEDAPPLHELADTLDVMYQTQEPLKPCGGSASLNDENGSWCCGECVETYVYLPEPEDRCDYDDPIKNYFFYREAPELQTRGKIHTLPYEKDTDAGVLCRGKELPGEMECFIRDLQWVDRGCVWYKCEDDCECKCYRSIGSMEIEEDCP